MKYYFSSTNVRFGRGVLNYKAILVIHSEMRLKENPKLKCENIWCPPARCYHGITTGK